MKKIIQNNYFIPIILYICGILLLIFSSLTTEVLTWVAGFVLLLIGAFYIIKSGLSNMEEGKTGVASIGIILFAIGAILIIISEKIQKYTPIIFGICIMVGSIYSIKDLLKLLKKDYKINLVCLLLTILGTNAGNLILINPLKESDTQIRIIGASLLLVATAILLPKLYLREKKITTNPEDNLTQ